MFYFISRLAVIRNMAFETSAFRKDITIFKGIETMVQVISFMYYMDM